MYRFASLISASILILGTSCSKQQNIPSTAKTPKKTVSRHTTDVKAEELVRRVADFYKSAKTIQLRSEAGMQVQRWGTEKTMPTNRSIRAERPNRIVIRAGSDTLCLDPSGRSCLRCGKMLTWGTLQCNRWRGDKATFLGGPS